MECVRRACRQIQRLSSLYVDCDIRQWPRRGDTATVGLHTPVMSTAADFSRNFHAKIAARMFDCVANWFMNVWHGWSQSAVQQCYNTVSVYTRHGTARTAVIALRPSCPVDSTEKIGDLITVTAASDAISSLSSVLVTFTCPLAQCVIHQHYLLHGWRTHLPTVASNFIIAGLQTLVSTNVTQWRQVGDRCWL